MVGAPGSPQVGIPNIHLGLAFPNLLLPSPKRGVLVQTVSYQAIKTTNDQLSGILTALTQPSPDALRQAIRETKKLTSKPFGVNITLLPSINPPDYEGYARAAVEEGVRIFETAGNNRKAIHICSETSAH